MIRCAIIGFGEVGSHFARDLHSAGAGTIQVYDLAEAARCRAAATGYCTVAARAADAAGQADIVFVAVTAGSVIDAISALIGSLGHRPFVIDINSVSPATKRQAAGLVNDNSGRYVEAAIMTSISAKGLRSPMLLGGMHAAAFAAIMQPFGMNMRVFSEQIGSASAVKMCRSIMIKGMEALAMECLLTARRYGVEQDVLLSLSDQLPHADWQSLAHYLVRRSLLHGKRRSEEMEEVARTVTGAGIDAIVSPAIAARQLWAGNRGAAIGGSVTANDSLGEVLDALMG